MFKRYCLCILLLVFHAAMIQAGVNKRHPGYVDLSGIKIPEDSFHKISILIDSDLIGRILPRLSDLNSVCIKSFDFEEDDTDQIMKDIRRIEKKLEKEKWIPVVQVKSNDELLNICMKLDKHTKKNTGLMLISYEPGDEVTFLNIAGSIPLERLKDIDIDLDDDTLDSLKKALGKYNDDPDED